MKVTGLESIKTAIATHMRDMQAAMVQATQMSAEMLLLEMRTLAARIDHDLADLKRLGHPYGYGPDRFGRMREPGRPHPDWLVHIQEGDLQAGLKRLPVSISGREIEAQILSEAEHTWFLLLGTRKMRPRDFVSAAIIKRRIEIELLYLKLFLGQLDRVQGGGFRIETHLLDHTERPAQLPEG